MMNLYLSKKDGTIEEINEIKPGCWIKLIAPTDEEVRYVSERLDVPVDFICDALDDEERSRIEKEDNHVLIIVDIPVRSHDIKEKATYDTLPLGIIMTNTCFSTVCLQDNSILDEFVKGRVRNFHTHMKTRFAFQMLHVVSTCYLRYLKQINRKTEDIEKELHLSMKNEELFMLMELEKSLVYFMTSLKANNVVLERLLRLNYMTMHEDDQEILEDVIIENKQAVEMAEVYSTILSTMMTAVSSIITNNVNAIMKFLATVTIMLAIPTMFSGFMGMNTPVPFAEDHRGFWFIVVFSIIVVLVVGRIFWKKRYF